MLIYFFFFFFFHKVSSSSRSCLLAGVSSKSLHWFNSRNCTWINNSLAQLLVVCLSVGAGYCLWISATRHTVFFLSVAMRFVNNYRHVDTAAQLVTATSDRKHNETPRLRGRNTVYMDYSCAMLLSADRLGERIVE